MKKDKEHIRFRIKQLRQESILHVLESIALTFVAELTYILLTILFELRESKLLALSFLVLPLWYFIYVCIRGRIRTIEIRKLEKEIYSE